jgi:REP element-mobilizing transposase RayT
MHSFNSVLIHCVWSTKARESLLTADLQDRLWPYLGGIARENKMKAMAIGGAADHVHMLISLPDNSICCQSSATSKGQFFQMGSRNISQAPSFCMAGRLWRIQRWSIGLGCDRGVHSKPSGASSNTYLSRRVYNDSAEARFRLRRTDAGLILSSLPGLGRNTNRFPSAEAPGYLLSRLSALAPDPDVLQEQP